MAPALVNWSPALTVTVAVCAVVGVPVMTTGGAHAQAGGQARRAVGERLAAGVRAVDGEADRRPTVLAWLPGLATATV